MAEGKVGFRSNMHTWQSGSNNRKLEHNTPAAQPPKQLFCPQCCSNKLYKDGLRYLADGKTVQRWLCRDCGYRFSQQKPLQKNQDWQINTASALLSKRQVCELLTEESKNLTTVETRQETAQREGTAPYKAAVRGLITKYMAYLEREGYSENSGYLKLIRRLANSNINLSDPEDVKTAIAKQPWKDSVKMLAVYAYDAFAKMEKIAWNPPKYKQEDSLPFVPSEKELDQLIASCQSRRMATFLQTLKETFADPSEVLKLRWIDISADIITINQPVKGHLAGQIKVSSKLIAMLNALPKTSERIFPTNYQTIYQCFAEVRKRAARLLQNPRLLSVSFKSFRHWGGSMIAHYTHGNVLTVKKLLRHKRIENTMKYIHMIEFKDDEFDVAAATSLEEVKQLASAGFEKFDEINGIHVFRRPKRFQRL